MAAMVFALAGLAPAVPAEASSYVVNTTDNTWDGHCDAHCSLWDAQQAAFVHPGPDRITFAIPRDGPYVIMLATPEGRTFDPVAVGDDGTEIDATTQPGWPVYLHGLGLAGYGMILASDENTVRGLGFLGFTEAGLAIEGEGNFIDRVVAGDYLGEGLILAPIGNQVGIQIDGEDNTLRGVGVANNTTGILITARGQTIQDSQIGYLSGSSSRRGNEKGLLAYATAGGNTIQRNAVMGNTEAGIELWSSGNVLTENKVGLDSAMLHTVGNGTGIRLRVQGGNRVGGIDMYKGNVIVANELGIEITSPGNQVLNNRIGVDFAGRALPNGTGVLMLATGEGSVLGSESTGAGNLIAFNSGTGVEADYATLSRIVGNSIYSNGGDGISVEVTDTLIPEEGLRLTIQRNSIYSNGGLGIHIPVPAVNGNMAPPVLAGVEAGTVSGTTCPNCTVELFLAAPDPSGAGEGKTFLAEVTAGSDGSFRAGLPGLRTCDVITATGTDGLGNTSEFSRNAGVGICFRPLPLIAFLWILIAGGGGSAFTVIIRRRPLSLRSLPWIVIGGLLGMGLGFLMLRLPFVQVDWGQPEAQPAPAPAGGNLPAPITLTPILDITVTPVTPAPGPEVMAREDANCRQGPSTQFNIATHLTQGEVVPITGRLAQGDWWQVQPPDLQIPCWIAESVAEIYGDLSAVPVVVSPPTPTPTPTEEPPPQGCRCWTGNLCEHMPQCPAQCTPCPQ
ncbi:MAG: right-handed parallel beta-helix repeat-containing protein [Chloroflexi bacterium]|nr:right-handed parallel beta-helix repeat-containing protein [Chloroflexota bacterium]